MVLPVPNPTKSYWVRHKWSSDAPARIDESQIEAAESPLRHHRSTSELPSEADVVIVGSGYSGASTAYWLHKVCHAPGHIASIHAERHTSLPKMQPTSHAWSCSKHEISAVARLAAMVVN